MAKAPTDPAETERELNAIADELYAAKPDEFSAARDEHIKSARAAGNQALARELAKLRKPTISAWLINLLWRDQRDVMEQLFELAAELGRAQAEAAGTALRELAAQRRQIENALLRRAQALGREAGVSVNDSVAREAQETLSAALADPAVADEVRNGRLVKPASYSGFGSVTPGARPAAPTPAATAGPAPQPREPAEPIDLQAAQRARLERERAERRQAAERRVQEARAAVENAAREVDQRSRAADEAGRRHADLRQQLEALREQLRRVEGQEETAEREALAAGRAREQAERAHAAAQDTLVRAERTLNDAS